MDIRNWPMDRIMQLPDHCFGRQWPVAVHALSQGVGVYFDISEAGLGDKCVIWQAMYFVTGPFSSTTFVSLALGDVLPTTDAEFDALEPLFSDVGRRLAGRRVVDLAGLGLFVTIPMRLPVAAQGRRLVGRFQVVLEAVGPPAAILTVSSMPREVPDCLLSV